MRTLTVPLHMPILSVDDLIWDLTEGREVTFVKVDYEANLMTILHEPEEPDLRIIL